MIRPILSMEIRLKMLAVERHVRVRKQVRIMTHRGYRTRVI